MQAVKQFFCFLLAEIESTAFANTIGMSKKNLQNGDKQSSVVQFVSILEPKQWKWSLQQKAENVQKSQG